jgi:hypothetical protein
VLGSIAGQIGALGLGAGSARHDSSAVGAVAVRSNHRNLLTQRLAAEKAPRLVRLRGAEVRADVGGNGRMRSFTGMPTKCRDAHHSPQPKRAARKPPLAFPRSVILRRPGDLKQRQHDPWRALTLVVGAELPREQRRGL